MRLRAYILAMTAAVLIPAVSVQVYFARQAQLALHDRIKAESVRFTALVAADLQSVIEGARQFLSAVASIDAVADGDAEACAAVLGRIVRENPRYATIGVSNERGLTVCSSRPAAVGHDVSYHVHFQRAAGGEAFAIGSYVLSRGTGLPILHASMPLRDEHGHIMGVITAGLNLHWVRERLSRAPLPLGASVLLNDRDGTVLARLPAGAVEEGGPIPVTLRRAIESRNFGLRDRVDPAGVRRFFVTQPVGGDAYGLHVSVGVTPSVADADMVTLAKHLVALISAVLLLALAIGMYVGRVLIERPVALLLCAMEGWRADGTARVISLNRAMQNLSDLNEFRRLAISFDMAVTAVDERETQFRQIGAALEDGLLICEARGKRLVYASPAFWRLVGLSSLDQADGLLSILPLIHAEDRPRVRHLFESPAHEFFDIQYRLRRRDGVTLRIRHRRFPVNGRLQSRSVDILSDVTREQEAIEHQMMLAREVDHRAKNILAVVQSLVRLTPANEPKEFVKSIDERIQALARAHGLLASSNWRGARLDQLIRGEFAAYAIEGAQSPEQKPRFIIDGSTLDVRPEAVQAIAMVLHELTTNSVKYGALSSDAGTVKLSWSIEVGDGTQPSRLHLGWTELGGPAITGLPSRRGFGSRLIQTTIRHQLHGDVSCDWRPEGLECLMVIPAANVVLVEPKIRRAELTA
jgi:two-component sensor histidine kinase